MKKSVLILFFSFLNSSCDIGFKPYTDDFVGAPLPALHEAVNEDDIEKVKSLLSAENCNSEKFKGKSKEYLMDKGLCSDVNFKNSWAGGREKTALFYVKSVEMAELLISRGAIVTVKDEYISTPLHFADNPEVAKFFLDQGLILEAESESGYTPLHEAVLDGRIATARFLFEQGANPHAKDNNNWTPLDWAKQRSGFPAFLKRAKQHSGFSTSSLNRLIKDFEAYTPPSDNSQPDTSKESSDTPEPETSEENLGTVQTETGQ